MRWNLRLGGPVDRRGQGCRAGRRLWFKLNEAPPPICRFGGKLWRVPTEGRPAIGPRGAAEEVRSFGEAGAEAARSIAEASLTAEEELANTNRWMSERTSELWLTSLEPWFNLQASTIRLFEQFWRQAPTFLGFPGALNPRPMTALPVAPPFGLLAADLKEGKEAYTLRVEMPGLADEDVDVTLTGDALAVRAEKRKDQDEAGTIPLISERRFGRFDRTFILPGRLDRDRIASQVRNGVLDVTLPKAIEAPPALPDRSPTLPD